MIECASTLRIRVRRINDNETDEQERGNVTCHAGAVKDTISKFRQAGSADKQALAAVAKRANAARKSVLDSCRAPSFLQRHHHSALACKAAVELFRAAL